MTYHDLPLPARPGHRDKGGLLRTGPNQWPKDGRPAHLREALEGSPRRLRLDHIDLYQFHRPDPKVPFEDSVGAPAKMREEGKVHHVGLFDVTIDQLAQAQKSVPIVTVQDHYNLATRQSEHMMVAEFEERSDRQASHPSRCAFIEPGCQSNTTDSPPI